MAPLKVDPATLGASRAPRQRPPTAMKGASGSKQPGIGPGRRRRRAGAARQRSAGDPRTRRPATLAPGFTSGVHPFIPWSEVCRSSSGVTLAFDLKSLVRIGGRVNRAMSPAWPISRCRPLAAEPAVLLGNPPEVEMSDRSIGYEHHAWSAARSPYPPRVLPLPS